jgi:hypothetical protein
MGADTLAGRKAVSATVSIGLLGITINPSFSSKLWPSQVYAIDNNKRGFGIAFSRDPQLLTSSSTRRGRLCGLVVRVPGYRSRGPGFDSRLYQIF